MTTIFDPGTAIELEVMPTFPGRVIAGDGMDITLGNGNYTFSTSQHWLSIFNFLSSTDIAGIRADDFADRGAVLQGAIDAAGPGVTIFWPSGTYCSNQTLIPPGGQSWVGGSKNFIAKGATLGVGTASMNVPLVQFNALGSLKGFCVFGAAGAGTPNQTLIKINGVNNVEISDNYFTGGYYQVNVEGVSFYTVVKDNIFASPYKRHLHCNAPLIGSGFDLTLINNKFTDAPATADHCAYFNGAGSIVGSDNVFTTNNACSGEVVFFDQPASLFGGCQASDWVIEGVSAGTTVGGTPNAALAIVGTSGNPWSNMYFVNSLATGGNGVGVKLIFCRSLHWISGALSSVHAKGALYLPATAIATDFKMSSVRYDGNTGITPIQCDAGAVLSGDVISPTWGGSASLIDFSATALANIAYLNTFGGNKGTNGTPIRLPVGTVPGTRL